MTPEQCRAGRALVDWSRERLADASKVSHRTIVDFERGARAPRAGTLEALQHALEDLGVVFLASGEVKDGGPGVRMKKEG